MTWTPFSDEHRRALFGFENAIKMTSILPSNSTALSNLTIILPVGTFNHGDPNILCTPTKWTDILLFYVVNYAAHAATVKSRPGEKKKDIIIAMLLAFICPYSGVIRGIEAISRHSILGKGNDLQKAARAAALCVVVRSNGWMPEDGQTLSRSEVVIKEPRELGSKPANIQLVNLEAGRW